MENNNYSKWSIIFLLSVIGIFFVLWITVNIKCSLWYIGLLSILMYFNISVTGLCNALVGRQLPPENDVFWKVILMFVAVVSISIVLVI